MKTWEEVVEEIKDYMNDNPSEFEQIIEELDSIDGYLDYDRYYEMEYLNEIYSDTEPLEIINRAFYGYDEDSWKYDSQGQKDYGQFNPNRDYFHFNGYGNLVSSDYKDYSSYLDEYFIQELIDNRDKLNLDFELEELLDEAEEAKAD